MMWFLDLPQQHHEQLRFLLDGYEDFFDTSTATLGKKNMVKHTINTGDASPLQCRSCRVSPTKRHVIQTEASQMLDKGVVIPSSSLWPSPVALLKKKDRSWRRRLPQTWSNYKRRPPAATYGKHFGLSLWCTVVFIHRFEIWILAGCSRWKEQGKYCLCDARKVYLS